MYAIKEGGEIKLDTSPHSFVALRCQPLISASDKNYATYFSIFFPTWLDSGLLTAQIFDAQLIGALLYLYNSSLLMNFSLN